MNVVYFVKITTIFIVISLAACSGSLEGDPANSVATDPLIAKPCDIETSYSLFWSWKPLNNERSSGYKIYYGNSAALTKNNALGYIKLGTGSLSTSFKPSDYNIVDCTNTYIGISATGTQPESALAVIRL